MREKYQGFVSLLAGIMLLGTVNMTMVDGFAASDLTTERAECMTMPEPEMESPLPKAMLWEPEEMTGTMVYAGVSDYLPALKPGNYEKWIDRIELQSYAKAFYDRLIEGADNDGDRDFLIDPDKSSDVVTVPIYENGKTVQAKGITAATITGSGSTWAEANEAANEYFFEVYYTLRTVFEAFDRDCPEVFWLSGSYYAATSDYAGSYKWNESKNAYDYYYTCDVYVILESPIFSIKSVAYQSPETIRDGISEINRSVETILSEVKGLNEEEKIRFFNHWLTTKNEYNYRIGKNHENIQKVLQEYPDAFECTAALKGKTGTEGPVCESYARAMKVLCDRSRIPCVLVDGYAYNALNSAGENHMWNYVKLDGAWYAVDTTWNDPLSGKAGAVSGTENENYMLIGGENEAFVGGGSMKFLDSHPVRNRMFTDGNGFANGPVLSSDCYVPTMESLSLTTNHLSVAYGFTELPVLKAHVRKIAGQTGEISYAWYEVDDIGNERKMEYEDSDTLVFPEGLRAGNHTIRVKATLGRCTKEADLIIQVQKTTFEDVKKSTYYYTPVGWAVWKGITTGYQEELFAPEESCTRGQVVTFLWRANGCPKAKTSINPFKDVKKGAYYYDAVLWAVENGITNGYSEERFAPEEIISRGQMVTFLHRTEKEVSELVENPFSDIKEGMYYYNAILWAVEKGVTTGYSNTLFAPEIECSRGQVVTFLYRNYN